ncbi:MAG: hypothetical protein WCR66_13290 [Bacteroidota bacterium]
MKEYKVKVNKPGLKEYIDLVNKFERTEAEFKTIVKRYDPIEQELTFFINGCASTFTDLTEQLSMDSMQAESDKAAGIPHPHTFISLAATMINNDVEIIKLTQSYLEQIKILNENRIEFTDVDNLMKNIDANTKELETDYKLIHHTTRKYEKHVKEVTEAYKIMTKKHREEYQKYVTIGIQNKSVGRNVIKEFTKRIMKRREKESPKDTNKKPN